ncbi:DNA-directed RNA polymerase specialized sigma subunit, sigma24 family [Sporobacter termitidis DSM 10068]|uniref:DNA-directed RNA polymerase specialized sigma subunit, sigma24 family n=1 Tax=Sporobacter termitidis DSM 10068 TaxID=1123282 RepID=A0A1M5XHP4_9FIRM|nr:DNA-directed RNA polymerase specialized sigma subunit, sigma24 family [Sporobacter termitidis DSM 10068]
METGREIQKQVEFLYQAAARQLYNMALYTVGDREAAEEITIHAFTGAFRKCSDKTNVDLFKEQSIKLIYRHGRKLQRSPDRRCTAPETAGQISAGKKEFIQMLSGLSFDERYILLLFCWHGFSVRQIAKAIGRPVFLTRRHFESAIHKAVNYRTSCVD